MHKANVFFSSEKCADLMRYWKDFPIRLIIWAGLGN